MSDHFSTFVQNFPPAGDPVYPPEVVTLSSLLNAFGGHSFGDGVYRVHTAESAYIYAAMIVTYFPEFFDRVRCFGYDWLGRQLYRVVRERRSVD